jgi:hypothetical protein
VEEWKLREIKKEISGRLGIANEYIVGCIRLLEEAANIPTIQIEPQWGVTMTRCPYCSIDSCFLGSSRLHVCGACKREYWVEVI